MMPQLISSITTPPGNLLYYIVLVFFVIAALQVSLKYSEGKPSPVHLRKIRALRVILAGQFVLLVAAALAYFGWLESRLILPPLDRAIAILSISWAAWAWIQTGSDRVLDISLAIILACDGFVLVGTLIGWTLATAESYFAVTWYHLIWELFGSLIVLGVSVILLLRRPPSWISGLAFMVIQLSGILADLLIPHSLVDYSAPLWLANIAAFSLLLNLPQRSQAALLPVPVSPAHPVTRERRRYASDQKTFQSALNLAVETRPEQVYTSITRFVAHMMVADLVFLINAPDMSGEMTVEGGYDLIKEEPWPGTTLEANRIPEIARALQEGMPLRLQKGHQSSPDILKLADALGINETGNLMIVPLFHAVSGALGALLLFSSYSQRVWSQADLDYLLAGTAQLVRVLEKQTQPAPAGRTRLESTARENDPGFFASILAASDTSQNQHLDSHSTTARLDSENKRLKGALESAQGKVPEDQALATRQQVQELEEALYYARLRLNKLEKSASASQQGSAQGLASLLEAALLQASQLTEEKHVTMRIDIPNSLPPLKVDPGALKEVLVIALEKALRDTAVEGTIVLKAQVEANPSGAANVHLKVISTGTSAPNQPGYGDPNSKQHYQDEAFLQKARALITSQSGLLWVDPLPSGAVVTNVVMPAWPETGENLAQP